MWRATSIRLTLAFGEDSCIKRQLNLRLSDGLKLVIIRDFPISCLQIFWFGLCVKFCKLLHMVELNLNGVPKL